MHSLLLVLVNSLASIEQIRLTKVTTPPYSDPHIGRWCRPGKLFDRIGRRAAEMAARRPVARLPRKRRIVGVTSPQRLPPDSSAIVTPPGRGPWHCTDSVVFVAWRHSEPMLEDKSVCIDDFFQYLGNRLSVDSNRAESDP